MMAGNKQNILVQTSSGFYRFEGISRKFTQKLYEWEKAQGIAPEASTFALLSNCYVPTISSGDKPIFFSFQKVCNYFLFISRFR